MAKWLIVVEEMTEVAGGRAERRMKTLVRLGEMDPKFARKRLLREAKKYTPAALKGVSTAVCRHGSDGDTYLIVAKESKWHAFCTVRLLERVS
ncbi:hypothetical protein OG422_18020 [Streptomyces sp. NBC_01525]|uniref:hypothetical protein n=1 Tax=Streptomyces sp. NBC_01525 TaxID=2903893 RepID=UPI003867C283